jgi:hypothetical protein
MNNPVIENAVVGFVTPTNGQQRIMYTLNGRTDWIWLVGINRAIGVVVGDKGRLVYRTTPNSALWYFERYKEGEGN